MASRRKPAGKAAGARGVRGSPAKGRTTTQQSTPRRTEQAPSYLKRMSVAVREEFARATSLSDFLATAGTLTLEERNVIVRQALLLIEQNYAHLPLKRAMHSIDPVQRLKLLLQSLEHTPKEQQPSEAEFHREVTDVFISLRDLHTNYLLPSPFAGVTAFLPFMVEDYYDGRTRKYMVSHIVAPFRHETFVPGVEVVYWNGTPIERAVLNSAQRYAGSNREARLARGVQTLTTRALRTTLPPDEEWVVVGYRTKRGKMAELRFDWVVNPPAAAVGTSDPADAKLASAMGIDLEQHLVQQLRQSLFAPQVVTLRQEAEEKQARGDELGSLESVMPAVFEAKQVPGPDGPLGYLRIRTFAVPPDTFVPEFIRLTAALSQRGLIVDVRGNGGGYITSGEMLLQLLTPRRIEPEPVQFINTPLNLEICRRNDKQSPWTDLSRWTESMQQALQTGATFSAGFPISDVEACNAIGQRYFGPVVLITDALCYSTTDIFAAGFQDHEIGPVLGTDDNTGAGGANVWEHRYFVDLVLPGPDSAYKALPNGAGMRVSMRRTLRVGRRAGTPVEDLGVVPDYRHHLTRDDLLHSNVDLIARAAALLAERPVRALTATVRPESDTQSTVTVSVERMTRLDVYLDDRPIRSVDVDAGEAAITIGRTRPGGQTLEIRGFDGTELVARYRTNV